MSPAPLLVLFLRPRDAAQSILAEAVLSDPAVGQGRFARLDAPTPAARRRGIGWS